MSSIKYSIVFSLLPVIALAQECPGTTYSNLCCHGELVGSSVAIPPASTFPLGTPPPYTASNDFVGNTQSLPSSLRNNPTISSLEAQLSSIGTDPAGLSSFKDEFDSLLSEAATDTNIFSILPISFSGIQKRASVTESVLTAGVTCRGSVNTMASMASETGSSSTRTSMPSSSSAQSTSSPSPTAAATTSSTSASESESSASATESSASSAAASTGAAPAATLGAVQKAGMALGAGFGVALAML